MQGVILSFDPKTNTGLIMRDTVDRTVYQMAPNALNESLFTTLRQGQRENEDSDSNQFATNVRLGSEIDMGISTARV